jgi:hypothetical protein
MKTKDQKFNLFNLRLQSLIKKKKCLSMDIPAYEIRDSDPVQFTLVGLSGVAANKQYVAKLMELTRFWSVVKGNGLNHKGKNVWVYESGDRVFAGVELHDRPPSSIIIDLGLEEKTVVLTKFAYYKHVGPYQQISPTGLAIGADLTARGYEKDPDSPYVELYGDWCEDESILETELFFSL